MIRDTEKQEIDLRILPHGLYYTSKLHENVIDSRTKELDNDFDTAESYMDAIKRITRFNDRQFINVVKNLNVEDFEKEIIVQYNFYCGGVRDMANWFIHTNKLMYQTENPYLISAFIEWEKSKVKEIAKQSMMNNKRKIARPMGGFEIPSIDIFLGMPHEEVVCEVKGEKTIKYTRIDTVNEEQLKTLAERKLSQFLLVNKFNTFNLFIESEINQAKSKQEWFNKHTEKEQFYPLEHYIVFLRERFKNPAPQQNKNVSFNSNHFNEKCFLLFEYLINNYEKDGIVKYININKYLKQYVAHNNQTDYRFTMKVKSYKELILKTYGVTIKKFETAKNGFEDIEVPILKDLTKKYTTILK